MTYLFPIGDWQFWVATAIVFSIVGASIGTVLALPGFSKARQARAGQKKTTLTVKGKAVRK